MDDQDDRTLSLWLELQLDRQPITGWLRPETGPREPFVGWLGFVEALRRLSEAQSNNAPME